MKPKILVVDDSVTIRKFITITLKVKGFDIICASDGMEALELLPNDKVDLIITDLNMPNIDGFNLIERIRSNENYQNTPIIVMSNLSDSEDIERAMQLGANSYIIKPFDQKNIINEIDKYLS
ncbi:MAG: response regulator [Ignavibacterium sp.]|nr:response regulator [Ignavibacterium sp.]MCX7610850.1 response regulator [Ignavibacterium sp.]MDW8374631.1 response regulator [Ignavibacteriales bacterium]